MCFQIYEMYVLQSCWLPFFVDESLLSLRPFAWREISLSIIYNEIKLTFAILICCWWSGNFKANTLPCSIWWNWLFKWWIAGTSALTFLCVSISLLIASLLCFKLSEYSSNYICKIFRYQRSTTAISVGNLKNLKLVVLTIYFYW